MKNQESIRYTYCHRKMVQYLAKRYVKEEQQKVYEQVQNHDLDKMFLYLFYNQKDASAIHRKLTSHHKNEIPKRKADYIEMVLDWESARYTKPDKPLNAYDTLYRYYPEMKEVILPILQEFGIAQTNLPMEPKALAYANQLKNVTMDEIQNEMIQDFKRVWKEEK